MTERVKGGRKWKTIRLPLELAARLEETFREERYMPAYGRVERLLEEHDQLHPRPVPAPQEIPA